MENRTRFQRVLRVAAFSTALLLSTNAWADLTGIIYRVSGNLGDATICSSSCGTNLGTFTVSSLTAINFTTNGTPTGDLADFMASGGVAVTWNGAIGDTDKLQLMSDPNGNPSYSTLIELTGTTILTNGTTYSISHDDGVVMNVNGSPFITAPGPVSVETSSAVWTGSPGTQTVEIGYMGTNGNPEVFQVSAVAAPEPNSVSLLVAMLAGVAGFVGLFKKKIA
jgi:hypothetical protein